MRTRPLRLAQISGLALSLAGSLAFAQPIITNWGGPANGLWSSAANWNPATVPMNVTPFPTFDVRITGGGSPVVHDKGTRAIPNAVTRLMLGNDFNLAVPVDRALTVTDQADLCGIVACNGGAFYAPMAAFTCNRVRLSAAGGGLVQIEGPSVYTSIGLGPATVLFADGAMSLVSLQTLTSISDAGWSWNPVGGGAYAHTIEARNGGSIDLRGVQTLTGPGGDERVEVTVRDGGTINLSALKAVSASATGWTDFHATGAATTLSLPSLETLSAVRFFADTAGKVLAQGAVPIAYSPGGLPPTDVMLADGAASVLDLRALASISDAGWSWNPVGGGSYAHSIEARNGGHIDLRGVQTLTGPAGDERVEVTVSDGGTINLSGLKAVSASATGWTDFYATGSATVLSLPALETLRAVRFFADATGQVLAQGSAPATYSPGGLPPTSIMLADGAASVLDLRALTSISDSGWSWNPVGGGSYAHSIEARNGGRIDLRSVQTLTGPAGDERVEVTVRAGGTIDLSALRTVSASATGWTDFYATGAATALSLPSIQSLSAVRFFADTAGQVLAQGASATYSPGGLPPTSVMVADGATSVLDLRALTSISDAGWSWNPVGGGSYAHSIEARNGGRIDLRSVLTITGPAGDERVEVTVRSGGAIDLSALRTVSASATGWTDFYATGTATTLSLPALETLSAVRFFADTAGQVLAQGGSPATYSPGGLPPTSIMLANGAASLLDLRALSSISDAGWSWNPVGGGSYAHSIEARNGGRIDLRGVQSITGPAGDERLEILVDGGTIALGTPSAIAGNIPRITLQSATSRLEVLGSLRLGTFPPPPVNPPLPMPLTAAAGATMTIGGDFVFTHTNEANVALDKATVQFDGAGPQRCEVGGLDLGPGGACLLPNGNFGFGQLVVGKPGQATTLRLSDLIDNGNRAGRAEALYLWGSFDRGNPPTIPCGPTTPQANGLRILSGSTLILDGVNVYAFQNGQWLHLNCFFSSTINHVAFDGGFIERAGCYTNCDNSSTTPILNVNDFVCFNNRFAEGNCYANCDGSTLPPTQNVNDFICFINKFATGCP